MAECEITTLVDLCETAGVVSADALGWSRRPLHRCKLERPWGRRKRWHYWCTTTAREVVSLTFADLDYAGLVVVQVIDRASGEITRDLAVKASGWRALLPDMADGGEIEIVHRGVRLAFVDSGASVSLRARTPRIAVEIEVARPQGHQSLGVAVAWPDSRGRRFAYTSKQTALPARGTVTIAGETRVLPPGSFACLDWGRGVWPLRTEWNWASASGVVDGRVVGLNLGARWTRDGTTENALLLDGVLHKIADEVRFVWDRSDPRRPWRIEGHGVDLTLLPEVVDRTRAPVIAKTCAVFGTFTGRILDLSVHELFGWAEEVHFLW
jgi:hypothetical protein